MRPLLLYTRIAWRNVRRNRRRSFITITAISFGVFCLLIFQALKTGLHREIQESTIRLDTGSAQIHPAGYAANLVSLRSLPGLDRVEAVLGRTEGILYSPRLKAPVLLLSGQRSSAVLLAGVDPRKEADVTFIAERIVKGDYLGDAEGILVGEALAKGIGAGPGDTLSLAAQDASGRPVFGTFTIRGIYRTELPSFDRSHVYLPLGKARAFLHAEGMVTEIAVLSGTRPAGELAALLHKELPPADYQVQTWEEIAPDVKQIIDLNNATMHLLILIVFTIVALGIANTMTMIVFERFKEFGILSSIGTPPAGVVIMILLESLLLGAIASAVGSLMGAVACRYLGVHGIDLSAFTSANQHIATSHILKARLLCRDLFVSNAVTLATALLSGIYPALKAARLKPVETLAHL
ncbi:MAG: FtsX-like permease family protein [Thermodesulfovibrionales bacterium]